MVFYAEPLPLPDGLATAEFVLEPLTTDHVHLDLAALMDSRGMLRLWSGTSWPSDGFTVEENWEDLDQHDREHAERVAFTFTVLDPTRTVCLGCVYIQPLKMAARGVVDPKSGLGDNTPTVTFWVRSPRAEDGLDRRLLTALRSWFGSAWQFPAMYACVREDFVQQREMLEEEGLELRATISMSDGDLVRLYAVE